MGIVETLPLLPNGLFWDRQFKEVFIPEIDAFKHCLSAKILPSFDDNEIGMEAKNIANNEYEKFMRMPAGEDFDADMADLAQTAMEKGIDYAYTMTKLKDGITNLFCVGLYHLFEQQLFTFYRKEILSLHEEDEISLLNWPQLLNRFEDRGLDLKSFASYREIGTLRLICNVIKHAEGPAAKDLRKIRPEYFMSGFNPLGFSQGFSVKIDPVQPLAGHDFKISSSEFCRCCDVCKQFWKELGKKATFSL